VQSIDTSYQIPHSLNRQLLMPSKTKQEYEIYFRKTLTEYGSAIARVISSYEMIKALQEELYQEISIALWKALAKFDNQSSLKTYVLSIAHKRSISHVAKYAKEPRTSDIANFELHGRDSPTEKMQQTQGINNLLRAIAQLSLMDRQLVTLALEGVSYKEIAVILGISTNLVGVKLNRAKSKLRTRMVEGE